MGRATVVGGIMACLAILGAGCGGSDQVEATGAAGDGSAEDVVQSDGSNNGERVAAEVEIVTCGRNANLSQIVVAGTVETPFEEDVEATLVVEVDIFAGGELLETARAEKTMVLYEGWESLPTWEVISSAVVDEDAGPYECETKTASLSRSNG